MFAVETRILIVDDMPVIRDLVRKNLKEMGFKNITEADSGEDAYLLIRDRFTAGNPFELVISDWNMPGMKGIDLLKRVRATPEFSQLPFVLLTSESERDIVTEAILSGVSQYIVKPFTKVTLQEKLSSAYQKHFKKP